MSIKLKLLRIQAELTLEELAQATSATRGYISKIERGLSKPSIGLALKLAKALRVPVEELFGEAGENDPVTITRATQAKAHAELGSAPRVIAGTSPGHRMMAFVVQPALGSRRRPMSNHEGEELLYVLKGSINLQLADRKEMLGPGDCAHFNSAVPHKITPADNNDAEVLIVIASDSSDE